MTVSGRSPSRLTTLAAVLLYAVLPGVFCGAILTGGNSDPLLPLPGVLLIPAGFLVAYLLRKHSALLSWLAFLLLLKAGCSYRTLFFPGAALLTGAMIAVLGSCGTRGQRIGFGAGFLIAAAGSGAGLLPAHYTPVILYVSLLSVSVYVMRVRWFIRILLIAAVPLASLAVCRSVLNETPKRDGAPAGVAALTAVLLPDCGENERILVISREPSGFAPVVRSVNFGCQVDVIAPGTPAKTPFDRGQIRVLPGAPAAALKTFAFPGSYDLIITESLPDGSPEARREFFRTLLDHLAAEQSVLVLPAGETDALPDTFRYSVLPFSRWLYTTRSGVPCSADPELLDRRKILDRDNFPYGVYAALAWRSGKDAVIRGAAPKPPVPVHPVGDAALFRWGFWLIFGYWIVRFYFGRSSRRASAFAVFENGAVFALAYCAFYAELRKNELSSLIPAAAWLGFPALAWSILRVSPRRAKQLVALSLLGCAGWFIGSCAGAAGAAWLGTAAENRRLAALPELDDSRRAGLLLAGVVAGMLLHAGIGIFCIAHPMAALLFFTLLFRAGALLRSAD